MEKRFIVIVVLVLGAAVLASSLQSGLTGNPIFRMERVIDLSEDVSDFGSENALVSEGGGSILSFGGGQPETPDPKTYCTCKEKNTGKIVEDNCANWQLYVCNAMMDCVVEGEKGHPQRETCEAFKGYRCGGCPGSYRAPDLYDIYDKDGHRYVGHSLDCQLTSSSCPTYTADIPTCTSSSCRYSCYDILGNYRKSSERPCSVI